MSFPSREDRNLCWGARDRYWDCLDRNKTSDKDDSGPCKDLRKVFESSCSAQWVKHFDRRRNYLQFKEQIEKHGYEPLDERSQQIPNKPSGEKITEKRRVYHEISCL